MTKYPTPTHWIDVDSGTETRIPISDPVHAHEEIRTAMAEDGYDLDADPAPRYRIDFSDGDSEVYHVREDYAS